MPVYEYRCEDCHQTFEKLLRFDEAQQTPECPHCHSNKARKLLSTFATRLASAAAQGGKLPGSSSSSCDSSSGGFR